MLNNPILRYVGVIRFAFCVLQFLPISFEQQNFSCISKSTSTIKIGLKVGPLLNLIMVIKSARLLIP